MKKQKIMLALAVLAVGSTSFAGCAPKSNGGADNHVGGSDTISLAHFDGNSADGSYDSKYFYRNDFTLYGGDSQVIYVSEEQSQEYGGYYYMYNSGSDWVPLQVIGGKDPHKSVISCFRSKDLCDWERCGAVDNGMSVRFEMDEWPFRNCWAPETIYNPSDNRYYMYFSAEANSKPDIPKDQLQYDTFDGADDRISMYSRFFLCVCVSDTPVGPFRLVTSESYYGDENAENLNGKVLTGYNPAINPQYDLGLDYNFAIIDAHPFMDDCDSDGDGQNDMYLYFVQHVGTDNKNNTIWGMKMKDMITPDYSSARMLTIPNYKSIDYVGGVVEGNSNFDKVNSYQLHGQFMDHEEFIKLSEAEKADVVDKNEYGEEYYVNEGPFMWKDGDRYYLTYSPQGVGRAHYQVRQAIGSSPLGTFEKLPLDPATIMGAHDLNDSMLGTGHHSFVEVNDELFCTYWPNATPYSTDIDEEGRAYAVDRIHFVNDPKYGKIMCGGPTDSLQAKPSSFTGRVNVATEATITATNADNSTIRYLNDEVVTFRNYYSNMEFCANGATTITLTFKKPTTVSAILIHNSMDYNYAFGKIDSILFNLSEAPAWYDGNDDITKAYIKDLPFNRSYVTATRLMKQGGASVASFKDIKVKSIEITVSEKLSTDGDSTIKISDIVVLGKED